jgi:hypothetical protein
MMHLLVVFLVFIVLYYVFKKSPVADVLHAFAGEYNSAYDEDAFEKKMSNNEAKSKKS